MRTNAPPFAARIRRGAAVLAVVSALLIASDGSAGEPRIKDLRTQKIGEIVYFEATIEAPDDLRWPQLTPQENASPELARRYAMQQPRLVPQDRRTVAVYLLSPRIGTDAPGRTLKFIGKHSGEGPAALRLLYPTGKTAVAPKGSLLEPYLHASTWAESALTIDFEKARQLAPPAKERRRDRRPTITDLERANVDLEGLWASAQARALTTLQMQTPGFGFYEFARQATGRKYRVALDLLGPPPDAPGKERSRLYELTTGGAALAESLAQRRLRSGKAVEPQRRTRDIKNLPRITIREHPWARMMGDKRPAAEPLAELVPHDQYYATAHGLRAYLELADLLDQWGGNVLHAFELSSRDEQVRARYEKQLCLPAARLAPKLGFTLVRDLAITGSDLCWREGSDVSVLFHVTDRKRFLDALEPFLQEARTEFGDALKESRTDHRGVRIDSIVTPGNEIRLHRAAVDDFVIFSNSPAAIRRILDTRARKILALADSLDFQYMRTIFRSDDKQEDGFAFLSDAFIRGLVGPASRLKEQRRLQALASLSLAHHAALFRSWETGHLPANQKELRSGAALDADMLRDPEGDEVTWDPVQRIAVSKTYGTRSFLTPLLEVAIDKITDQEEKDYLQFQQEYNRLWQRYFDPAGLRLSVRGQKINIETYILPLLQNQDYQVLRGLTEGGTTPLDLKSIPARTLAQLTINPAQALKDLLGDGGRGIGKQIFLRCDDGPVYRRLLELAVRQELASPKNDETQAELIALLPQLPITLGIEVAEEEAFDAVISRVFSGNQSELMRTPYKGISLKRLHLGDIRQGEDAAPYLYHAKVRGMWYASFHLDSVRRAIDQTLAREAGKAGDAPDINCSLYVAPRAFLRAAAPVHEYLEWQSHRPALENGAIWYALHRGGLIRPDTAGPERAAIAQRQLGFVPLSPEGAAYRYDAGTDEVVNERHGSARRPRLHHGFEPGSAGSQLLGLLRTLHVGLRFREDGIHTTLTFERSTDADKRSELPAGHLEIVKRGGWVEIDESRPGHPLARVDLSRTSIGDADLALLRNVKHLHTLNLDETAITDAGLKQLRNLPELRALHVDTPGVSDAGVKALAEDVNGLKIVRRTDRERFETELRRVGGKIEDEEANLADTKINDAWLAHLKVLPDLTRLNLARTAVTDAGLAHLKRHHQLRVLILDATSITDAGLEHLKELPNLTHLRLNRTRIRGEGLAHLRELPRLHRLELDETAITDAELKYLRQLKGLDELRIDAVGVSDAGADSLRQGKRLTITRRTDRLRLLTDLRALGGTASDEEVSLAGKTITDAVLARLKSLPQLGKLNLGGTSITDAGLKHLAPLKRLRQLHLPRTAVTDAGLEHLKELDRLEELDLSRTAIRGAGLSHLDGLTRLRRLDLDGAPITDADLKHLRGLKSLRTLNLDAPGVSDSGAASLQEALKDVTIVRPTDLDRLRAEIRQQGGIFDEKGRLDLQSSAVSVELLARLKRVPNLRYLNLHRARLREVGLDPLSELTELRELDLGGTGIIDADLRPLARLTKLELLDLDGTRVSGDGLDYLKELPKLRRLSLKRTPLDDNGLSTLKQLTHLRRLDLDDTAITDAGIKDLRGLTELRELHLDAEGVTDAGAEAVKKALPEVRITRKTDQERLVLALRRLGARGDGQDVDLTSVPFDSDLLGRLKQLPDLRRLVLSGTAIRNDALAPLAGLKNLQTLEMGQTSITNEGLVHLAGLTELRTLDLTGTKISDAGLKHLHALKNLRRISLDDTRVTDEGSAQLRKALPELKSIVRRTDHQVRLSRLSRQVVRLRGRMDIDDRDGPAQVKVTFYLAALSNERLAELGEELSVVHHLKLSGESRVGDKGLAGLKAAANLRTLDLSRTGVTDDGLEHLKDLTELRGLDLSDTHLRGAGLIQLKELKKLQRLDLGSTDVGDAGLAHLKGLTQLRELSLDFTRVSNASLATLGGLTRLERLNVRGTRITAEGIAALRSALPRASIIGD